MEPVSAIVMAALGYILKGAAQSKTAEIAKEDLLSGFWNWIRPMFLEDIPDTEAELQAPETEEKVQTKLLELIKDEKFFEELMNRVKALQQAGIKEKNLVKKDIRNVKRIVIGDKVYSPEQHYDRKNIVEGSVENADEFILGDGH